MCLNNRLRLEFPFTQYVIYYISSLKKPQDLRNHEECKKEECIAFQMRQGEYHTKHTNACKGCPIVGPDTEQAKQISTILRHDGIPVIQIMRGKDGKGNPRIEIVKAPGEDCLAISHVWSDGLGNPSENKMPYVGWNG